MSQNDATPSEAFWSAYQKRIEWWHKPVVSRYQVALVIATWVVLDLIKITVERFW